MKKKLNIWIAAVAFAAVLFTACSKEETQINTSPSASELSIPEIDVLSTIADEEFINSEIDGGTEAEEFTVQNDGIPDAYQVSESSLDFNSNAKRGLHVDRFKACLSKLKLSSDQIMKLRHLYKEYQGCNASIIKRYKHALRQMQIKYNGKYHALVKALRNGRITKAEFEKHVKVLRAEFKRAKYNLAVKSRAALKTCYIKMLRGMHGVLNDRQWKAFVNCYR
ncbi:MAG: hypothetical protein R2852_07060 [Bacteroidia bacterium]